MFHKVLIANRGEIACRIIRTLDRLGVASVAVYSEADRHAAHVRMAGEAVCIGPAAARESYLQGDRILEVAKSTGAEAIHPGYGFLSENSEFAAACENAGVAFVGPTPEQIRSFGLKHTSREIARACDVPLLPGTGLLSSAEAAETEALSIGWPVMLKSTAGGGGIGMQLCHSSRDLHDRFDAVRSLGLNNFKDSGVYLEKFVERARHVEVQIFGDGKGNVTALGERDCSVQRRNQKVIEETPAPGLTEETRAMLCDAASRLGRAVGYRSAGTVEFVYDVPAGQFYFLEVNTRLQVEHGVTELVTGLDLVEWMLQVAAGTDPGVAAYQHRPRGHAIQVRIYAEDPAKHFQPSSGLLTAVSFPDGVRCDHWIEPGLEVTPFYDPLLAKLLVLAETRGEALCRLGEALTGTRVDGIETNIDYLAQVVASSAFQAGDVFTGLLKELPFSPRTVDVLEGGTLTTVQDYPGRLGYWAVGVPPSGPMDPLAFRLGNRLLNNLESAAGLEITMQGPALRFNAAATVCLTGAQLPARLDEADVPFWQPFEVPAGAVLHLGAPGARGCRAYLTIRGGLDVPEYLGSRSTFTLGRFGGHGGRAIRIGDVLKLRHPGAPAAELRPLPPELTPVYGERWEIGVMYGPHGAPDFFTEQDVQTFFATDWKVHFNSARTGVRLMGPKPQWARRDGGEAGLHPSNIHDNAYAVGAVDFTGDMPIILGPDGPSLGGFVCPACVVQAELWKLGQLRPGDCIRFRALTEAQAATLLLSREEALKLDGLPSSADVFSRLSDSGSKDTQLLPEPAVLSRAEPQGERPAVVYRPAGDDYLLVEYGPAVLDLDLRFRVHALMTWLSGLALPEIVDLTPGIRSLQVHYRSSQFPRSKLLELLRQGEEMLAGLEDMEVPSRIVHLPLSWDDPATRLAIEKYTTGVRPDAPWCPSNIEFIRRINGLESVEQVRDIVFSASYLVLGLGDVYLGAPVAVPIDPRHRLVTTKYNPARTWTPENAVGIGGAYLCIYGMEGPGGYQFVGRTLQMWNRHRSTRDFPPGKPWLLRFFDQIRFHPVSEEELLRAREDFPYGGYQVKTEDVTFRLGDYHNFVRGIADEAAAFKHGQQAAFEAERERWRVQGLDIVVEQPQAEDRPESDDELPEGTVAARATMPANVWQVLVRPGMRVEEGDKLLILEAMKMEIPITSPVQGVVAEVRCTPGKQVAPGQPLCLIHPQPKP